MTMTDIKAGKAARRLERSCRSDEVAQIISAPALPGMARIQASFVGDFFAPHRHDTYAIGLTMRGIQAFEYRGERRFSSPGNIIVLHPDELHDGGSGTEQGLLYRMLYLEPSLVHQALGEKPRPLPFVAAPIVDDPAFRRALITALGQLDDEPDDLATSDAVAEVAQGLVRHSGESSVPLKGIATRAAWQAREYLCDNALRTVRSAELEEATGLDRFTLSRHFRATFGTSPHRFLLMRRLEFARSMIEQQEPLADVAAAVGFADQSHLTRHFKQAFGITPGKWAQHVAKD